MFSVAIVTRERHDTLQSQLVEAGYGTCRIVDVQRLLALLAAQHVDVVLLHPSAQTDDSMPDMVRTVTRSPHGRRTAVLPMLPRVDLAERVRSLWYGAANVVNLPLRDGELLAGIASVVGRNHARHAADTAAVV